MSADLLANVERHADDRPAASPERADPHAGYWRGSAAGHVSYWRARALRAEGAVDRLKATLAAWRPVT
ncbi:MAG TPA: hypothetical protein VGL81_09150 [Polyangiaceae bacterium]|jgi:hypothetical protein